VEGDDTEPREKDESVMPGFYSRKNTQQAITAKQSSIQKIVEKIKKGAESAPHDA
jgi:hypothetical protein